MVDNDSKKVYSLTYSFILFTSFLAVFIGEGTHMMYAEVKNDTLISAVIGFILSFILFYIVRWIINKNESEDVYSLNKDIFGKKVGSILNVLMWIGFFFISAVILYSMSDFFNTEYLPETSINYLSILVLFPVIYISSKEIGTLIKSNQILSLLSFGIIILCFIGISDSFELKNIEPLFSTSNTSIIKNVITYFVLSSLPLSMLLITCKKNIRDDNKLNSNLLKIYCLSNVVAIAIMSGTILTLGIEYIQIFRFPEYIALKQFSLFNILERVENILALQYFFNNMGLLCMLYYFLCHLLPESKIKKYYSILIGGVQIILTSIVFKNTITFLEIIQNYYIYVIGIFILFPILLIFFGMLKKANEMRKFIN